MVDGGNARGDAGTRHRSLTVNFSDGYHDVDCLTRRVLQNSIVSSLDKKNYRRSGHLSPFLVQVRRRFHGWSRLRGCSYQTQSAASNVVGAADHHGRRTTRVLRLINHAAISTPALSRRSFGSASAHRRR